jgi:chloramphenicol-sensitive protein RarD
LNRGILYGIGAYLCWGFFPIYWKLLQGVPAMQIMTHRLVWSFIFLAAIISWREDWATLIRSVRSKRILLIYGLAGSLLAVNWLVYIWAVNAGFVVETSLGYFINPLVNVLLGVIFLRERIHPLVWIPIGLASAGVLYLTLSYGSLPWIALVLAFTFGFYGLVKKTAPLGSLHGLTLETALLTLPALAYLAFTEFNGSAAFGHVATATTLLLAFTGVVTAVPLLLFGMAARQIPLWMLGLLQYIAPSIQFLIGILLYHEPFTPARLVGFSLIWGALLLYWLEGAWLRRRSAQLAGA